MERTTIFNELRLEGKLCDVVIQVSDIEFKAHKNILCGCSPYFRALFTSGWTEKHVYNILGLSPDMMRILIQYAYTCSVLVTAENVLELLAAADQFCITGVVQACCDYLESLLCLENCIGIWRLTDIYHCPDLRDKAYLFILHGFEEMVRVSEEFLELSLQQLAGILGKDELNVKQEVVVFETVLRWITHLPEERKGHIAVLLPKVRLGLLTADYFMNNVKENSLVKDNYECRLIINSLRAMYELNIPSTYDFCNPLTRPRLPCNILLAIGGWSAGSPTNSIEAYDARADVWVTVTDESPTSPRAYHGAAFLNGFVYCAGGFDSLEYFNGVCKFDIVTRTWHQVAPMHCRRCYVSITVLHGCIYVMGGFNGHVRLNTAERYEPETNQWTLIAPMNEHRSDASAATLNGKVYICGGFNGEDCLQTAERYNPETDEWTAISPMLNRRSGVGVITYGEHIYAVGGFDGYNRLRNAEAYNPLTDTWHAISDMLNPRSNFGIEVVDDLLFAAGGFNGFTTTSDVEYYDKTTNEWYSSCNMAIFRSALSCCVVHGLSTAAGYTVPRGAAAPQRPQGRSV
ncbi:kelch-like protein 10 [Polymixia lowei]